jgi:hypothetical protein
MERRDSDQQESIDSPSIEDINQLKLTALGAGAAVCQRCGKRFHGGEHVSVYVFRRCPHATWLAGQARCADHPIALDTLASLGVREYVVSGRVGHCIDHTRQREWPVLLAPELEAVSPPDTETAFDLPGVTPVDVTDCPIAEATLEDTPTYEYAEATR